MRRVCAVFVVLGLPTLVAAQRATPTSSAPSTLAPIGLPLPPIGLPLPAIGLPPPGPSTTPHEQPTLPSSSPPDRRGNPWGAAGKRRPLVGPAIVVYGSPYLWSDMVTATATPGVVASAPAPAIEPVATGRLRLELHPADLQLFVDGEYVGTSDDMGAELELEAGTRRIEIRAPGYETLNIDARIAPGRTITYRGALEPRSPAASAAVPPDPAPEPSAPLPKQTLYFIPGCYLGNVPPHEVRLPPGCDLSRMTTRRP
jgi:hypothetical protein